MVATRNAGRVSDRRPAAARCGARARVTASAATPTRLALALLLLTALLAGCLGPGGASSGVGGERGAPALRIGDFAGHGGPVRRAATRLVLQGLDADARAQPDAALAHYQRALQVDPENPFAWLALARHEVFNNLPTGGSARRALAFLDKAEAAFGGLAKAPWRLVTPHFEGLRGVALLASGRAAEARPHQLVASRATVWADGRLDAAELR